MRYNKLVRDKIPEYIEAKGGRQKSHVADDAEYERKLGEKLGEEVSEFLEAPDNFKREEEMADIWEVADALRSHYGLNQENIYKIIK